MTARSTLIAAYMPSLVALSVANLVKRFDKEHTPAAILLTMFVAVPNLSCPDTKQAGPRVRHEAYSYFD